MSFALLFSGQGLQHPAMLPWLAEDTTLRRACRLLGVADWRAALADAAWAQRNLNAQLLLTGSAIAAWRQIAPSLPAPVAIAGYSVGELAAFCAAGVFDADSALDLARERALAMDACALQSPGGLLAVSGLAEGRLAALCAAHGLDIAIRIGGHQAVVGGALDRIDQAEPVFAGEGARCTRLKVAVPSHTPGMQPAAQRFQAVLSAARLRRPGSALFCNASGQRVMQAEQCAPLLAAQICSTVQWSDCLEAVGSRQPRCVLEVGPGQALARMWNERYAGIPARSCDDFRSAEAVSAWIADRAAG